MPICTKHENFQWHFTNIATMNVRSVDRNSFPTPHKVRLSLRWFSWNSRSPNRFLNTRGLRVRTLNTDNYEQHNSKKKSKYKIHRIQHFERTQRKIFPKLVKSFKLHETKNPARLLDAGIETCQQPHVTARWRWRWWWWWWIGKNVKVNSRGESGVCMEDCVCPDRDVNRWPTEFEARESNNNTFKTFIYFRY